MQKKVNLLLRDEFSLLVGVRAAVKLIVRTVRGRPGFNEVRIEDGRFLCWDDCTEALAPDGPLEAWQVKSQTTPFRELDIQEALVSLRDQPTIAVGHLASEELVDVQNCGPLRALATLCDRLANKDIDYTALLSGLTKAQKDWVDSARRMLGAPDDDECLRTLQRLRVERVGTAHDLRENLLNALADVCDDPERLLDRLRSYLRDHLDAAARITWQSLQPQVEPLLSVKPKQVNVIGAERARSWIDAVIGPTVTHLEGAIPLLRRQVWTWRWNSAELEAFPPLESAVGSRFVRDDFMAENPAIVALYDEWRAALKRLYEAARAEGAWLASPGSSLPTIVSNVADQFMNTIPSPYTPPWDGVGKEMFSHAIAQHLVNNVGTLGSEHASAAFWNKYRTVFIDAEGRSRWRAGR